VAIVEDPEDHEFAALQAVAAPFRDARILEIGCGDGRLTRRYVHDAASIVAIDPDAEAIAELTRELPRVDARAIGVEELDLPEHSVDVVLFAWSL
jgi:16S rRNA A1518/A1519 N6-dimethyltransferase RsmA/KsgA/DIM1 with predicted DNA glycosylase/AP lyase activity